uniref:Dynein regulatory complex protein 9 n=1 Tax=Leptocylindrus danicus TaxID=163516 RepID=A0A7S2KEZ6_9STRA|mmetsp:Transcript_22127/g.33208  ORF Transcript_22127/g.33208 Transcript_22127/m.33208 type:complete len:376 (+) Transcript_22127:109-1236(+)|eukprot:CAMPEP_0116012226 /NCGR_PEP_ID=MMETSP0321-20121206/5003_1 /TAXON_ID=163516 /ORGANISM="Leptocylindrus danicus var. danicus, Strain B650" /LENGTH=375 /DNA_ID=CAMNT_0003481541 /DNA_START=932 /DNA_END=2059 /DNA_ORIENTATION=-
MKLKEKVVYFLQESIDKLRRREIIEPDALVFREQHADELGGKIKLLHVELQGFETELRTVVERTNLRDLPNKMDFKKTEERKQLIRFNISDRRKALTKAIKQHVNVMNDLAKLENDRNDLVCMMESTLQEFKRHGTARSLEKEVEVLKSLCNQQIKLENEQEYLTKAIDEAKLALNAEKTNTELNDIDEKIEEVKEEISRLADEITPIVIQKKMEAAIQIKNKSSFEENEYKLAEEIERLKHRIKDERVVHDQNIEKMTKCVHELESEVSNMKRSTEEELSSLNMKHATLSDERETCLASLLNLKRRYENERHLEEARKQERLLQAKRLKEEKQLEEKRYFAAFNIQRRYRSFLKRKKAKAKPVKKKKKKNKSKK